MHNLKKNFDKTMMEEISDIIYVMKVVDQDKFIYEYVNRSAQKDAEYNEQIIGKTLHEVSSPEKATFLYDKYKQVATLHENLTYRDSYLSKEGEERHYDAKLVPLLDSQNNCTHVIAIVKDITTQLKVATELEIRNQNLEIITKYVDDLITLVDSKGEIIFASPSYENILGFEHHTYMNQSFLYNVHPYDRIKVNKVMTEALQNKSKFSIKFRQRHSNNKWSWFESKGAPIFDSNGEFEHVAVITRDISLQKTYEEKLEQLALQDPLTRLPNRRLFMRRLKQTVKNAKKSANKVVVFMIDIDNFKTINDTMGHDIGDEVIKEYSKRISKVVKKRHTFARLGGDEFTILVPNAKTKEEIVQLATSIQTAIRLQWDINGQHPKVTTSMGIAIAHQPMSPSTLLKHADDALYEAKRNGKNTFHLSEARS